MRFMFPNERTNISVSVDLAIKLIISDWMSLSVHLHLVSDVSHTICPFHPFGIMGQSREK